MLRLSLQVIIPVTLAVVLTVGTAACSTQTSPALARSTTARTRVGSSTGNAASDVSGSQGDAAPSLSSRNTAPVVIEDIKSEFWEDYSFITTSNTPLSPQQLATMNGRSDLTSPPPGTIIANSEWLILTVAGNSASPVTINNITVNKSCETPPSGGTLFYSPTAGAGPFPVASIYFNLDMAIPVGRYQPISGDPIGGNFFAKEAISLRYQEPQTLAIYIVTSRYCHFSFTLNVATFNGPVAEKITDGGKPFSITSDDESDNPADPGSHVPFSSYNVIYAGGSADQQNNGAFMRVNPATYKGSGDPASFSIP